MWSCGTNDLQSVETPLPIPWTQCPSFRDPDHWSDYLTSPTCGASCFKSLPDWRLLSSQSFTSFSIVYGLLCHFFNNFLLGHRSIFLQVWIWKPRDTHVQKWECQKDYIIPPICKSQEEARPTVPMRMPCPELPNFHQ